MRRIRHGQPPHGLRKAIVALGLGLCAASVPAACPPGDTDGVALKDEALTLAFRPLLITGEPTEAARIPLAEHFALDIQVCSANAASPARLSKVDATMPAHRHGMNYRPVITALGNGRYRVEGLMFHMAGLWQLGFELQAGPRLIRISHDLQIN